MGSPGSFLEHTRQTPVILARADATGAGKSAARRRRRPVGTVRDWVRAD